MAHTLLEVIYKFFVLLTDQLLGPLFSLLDSFLLNIGFTQYIDLFYTVVAAYISPFVGFIFEFMGPRTVDIILMEFLATIGFHAIVLAMTGILKVLKVIKKFPMA